MSNKIKDGDVVKVVKNVGSKENNWTIGKLFTIIYAGFAGIIGVRDGSPYTLKEEEINLVRRKHRPRKQKRPTKQDRTSTMRILKK